MERDWHEIASGKLTEQKIHERLISMKSKLAKAERDSLADLIIAPDQDFEAKAEEEANSYFRTNYQNETGGK